MTQFNNLKNNGTNKIILGGIFKMIRKLKIFALLATLTFWSINCSSGGGTPPPEDGTFKFVCQDGTPTAGTTALQGTPSCSACNAGFDLTGTQCVAVSGPATFSYVCPNGTPTAGMIATEDTTSCSACNSGFDLSGTNCDPVFNYVCPNGTPTDGTTALQGTQSCKACNEPDFSRSGTDCNPVAAAEFSFVCENGVAAAGTNSMEDRTSCQSCNNNYALDGTASAIDTTCIVELDGTFRRIGASGLAGLSLQGLASIGTTLYIAVSAIESTKNVSVLYTVNPSSGAATRIGTFEVITQRNPNPPTIAATDLASIGNTLYMVGRGEHALYTVNTNTGAATRVARLSGARTPRGLASITDSSTGTPITTLYMVADTNNALYRLNTSTGDAIQVGLADEFEMAETSPRGLASIGTTLYMVGNIGQSMYTVDTTTGIAEQVGLASFFGTGNRAISPTGLASITDGGTTTLYMVDEAGRLYAAP